MHWRTVYKCCTVNTLALDALMNCVQTLCSQHTHTGCTDELCTNVVQSTHSHWMHCCGVDELLSWKTMCCSVCVLMVELVPSATSLVLAASLELGTLGAEPTHSDTDTHCYNYPSTVTNCILPVSVVSRQTQSLSNAWLLKTCCVCSTVQLLQGLDIC